MAALFQLFDGIQIVAVSALRGVNDARIPAWIAFVAYWLVALPVGACARPGALASGAIGVWAGSRLRARRGRRGALGIRAWRKLA